MPSFHPSSAPSSPALGVYPDPVGVCSVVNLSSFLFLNLKPKTENLKLPFPPKFNYSPTYAPFFRKSNHSHTYAKTGGWGCLLQVALAYNSFVFFHCVNHFINYNCRRADIPIPAREKKSGPPKKDGPYTRRRNPRTDLKVGHCKREPRCRFRNAGATRPPFLGRLHL
jgi:hypothetical protein